MKNINLIGSSTIKKEKKTRKNITHKTNRKKEIYWVEPYDKDGNSFSASVTYSWKEAYDTAKFYKSEADEQGYYQICIWENRIDLDYGDQPNYSIDPAWMWKRE